MTNPARSGVTLRNPQSLCDVFQVDTVLAPLQAADKDDVLQQMVDQLAAVGRIPKAKTKEVLRKVKEREEVGTTGIGRGFAVPHIRYGGVDGFMGVFAYAPDGVEFASLDGTPAKAIFLVVSPADLKHEHVQLMSRLTRLMNNADFMQFLKSCSKPQDYIDLLAELEPPL